MERDKGKALAAHSTLNRLELSAHSIDLRYQKIQVQPDETEQLIIITPSSRRRRKLESRNGKKLKQRGIRAPRKTSGRIRSRRSFPRRPSPRSRKTPPNHAKHP
jgi:hypothetical protein